MRKAKNNVFGGTFVQLAKQFVDGIAKDIVGQRLVRFDNKHETMHFGELVKHWNDCPKVCSILVQSSWVAHTRSVDQRNLFDLKRKFAWKLVSGLLAKVNFFQWILSLEAMDSRKLCLRVADVAVRLICVRFCPSFRLRSVNATIWVHPNDTCSEAELCRNYTLYSIFSVLKFITKNLAETLKLFDMENIGFGMVFSSSVTLKPTLGHIFVKQVKKGLCSNNNNNNNKP